MSVNIPPQLLPLPVDEWAADLTPVAEDMNGAPINVHKLMAHNPALLKAWWSFRNHSVEGGTLGPRWGELVILRVGMHMQAWYEWGSHVDRSLRWGLSLEEINRVATRDTSTGWSDADASLLQAVDELIETNRLSDTMRARLSAHFTTAQALDLIAIHGMYVILGCMIRTWGLQLDQSVAERIAGKSSEEEFAWRAWAFHAPKQEEGDHV